jgi:hypothetical protein
MGPERPTEAADEPLDGPPLSLLELAHTLATDNAEARVDAVEQLATVVSEAFGAEGAALGAALREAGIVAQLARLLSDATVEVRLHAILALGNLCSDSVDPHSRKTKALCLELVSDAALVACISDAEPSVVLVGCAMVQNLSLDAAWAARMVATGVGGRLEQLLSHGDARLVRYASGALKNLTLASQSVGGPAPQLSMAASHAVRQREREDSLEMFMRRRACRAIGRAVQSLAERRLPQLLAVHPDIRGVRWLDAVSHVHTALSHNIAQLEEAQSKRPLPAQLSV